MDNKTANQYRAFRSAGMSPAEALQDARYMVAKGAATCIGYVSFQPSSAAPGAAFKSGSSTLRWFEKPAAYGLRFVGYADKIAGLRHWGWFTRDDGDTGETLRGVVFQLPGRDGKARFVAGYDNAVNGNADEGGPCAISFDEIFEESGDVRADHDHYGAHRDCAYLADSIAEYAAENERDHQRAADARIRHDELVDEIRKMRTRLSRLLKEAKILKPRADMYAAVKGAVCDSVASYISDIQKARKERRDLADLYARASGWES